MFNKEHFQRTESINSSDQYIDTATTYVGEVRFDKMKYELKIYLQIFCDLYDSESLHHV